MANLGISQSQITSKGASGGGGGGSIGGTVTASHLVGASGADTLSDIPGSSADFVNGLVSLAPTGRGVVITATGDAHSSDILDLYANGYSGSNQGAAFYDEGHDGGIGLYLEYNNGNPGFLSLDPGSLFISSQGVTTPTLVQLWDSSNTEVFAVSNVGLTSISPTGAGVALTVAAGTGVALVVTGDASNSAVLTLNNHTTLLAKFNQNSSAQINVPLTLSASGISSGGDLYIEIDSRALADGVPALALYPETTVNMSSFLGAESDPVVVSGVVQRCASYLASPSVDGSSSVTTIVGFVVDFITVNSAASATNVYGVHIANALATTGAVGTIVGVNIADQTVSGAYAIKTGLGQVSFGDVVYPGQVAFASLPTPSAGAMIYCTDAKGPQDLGTTWGSIAAGSGTGSLLVYDGTNWRVH
jgi:hypothetical protein